MRTTVNLDDDVLFAVQERARRERRTAGQVLSELARQALTGGEPEGVAPAPVLGFAPLPSRGTVVTNELIDRLREDEGV
jgi:hypothetical protein